MGGPCPCTAWICRPAWPVFVILASISCVTRCEESPAVVVGKMYPRGNHWAVGHLMGKKSIEILPELQDADQDSGYLPASETAAAGELSPFEGLLEALLQHKNQKQAPRQASDQLLWLHGGWREEDRDKYLREISDLLLLAMKPEDDDSD